MTIEPFVENTGRKMARYSAFLGRSVEVQYRAGDICLPAVGTLVADSGRSIFLEQHYQQRGQQKNFRWEVPYSYIVRIEEKPPADAMPAVASRGNQSSPATPEDATQESDPDTPQASAARAAGGGGGLLPFANRPKTA